MQEERERLREELMSKREPGYDDLGEFSAYLDYSHSLTSRARRLLERESASHMSLKGRGGCVCVWRGGTLFKE